MPGWKRWIRSKADEVAVDEGCYFDIDAAERVRSFFRRFLRHSKGQWAGEPFELLEWQWDDVIAPLFGWRRQDKTRRFRRAYIEIPKKNGKSCLASGLSLYLLCADGEPGAEIYSAASDRDQASIVFNEAAHMVNASVALSARITLLKSTKRMMFNKARALYKALSADVPTKEGLNAHAIIFDELHAQKTRNLWDVLRYAGAARRQPLLISITTAGWDRNSICWEQHQYAEGIVTGDVTDSAFFGYIRAAGFDEDWTDPAVWERANPSFGVTLNADQFAEDCKEAQLSSAKENSFRRYRLNQWTEQDIRWIQMDRWDECTDPPQELDGRECWCGLDLSSTVDITALVMVFPSDDGSYDVLTRFWVPEEGARQRSIRDRVPYDHWIKEGYVDASPGDVIDYDRIRAAINELADKYDIREIAIDRWNATQLSTQLDTDGFTVVPFGQGYASMTWPTKKLEELILSRKIRHGGNPVLRWMARNVSIEKDAADNWKPSKKRSTERIDGIVALVMAIGAATVSVESGQMWDDRGGIVL